MNYVANAEVNPTRILFENGRVVELRDGALEVGWSREEAARIFRTEYQVFRQSTGVDAIAAERERQVTAEGWHEGHDDEHDNGSLAGAAAAYAIVAREQALGDDGPFNAPWWWSWDLSWWKPKDARRNLVRAGALIAAEIDRIDRAERSRTVAGTKQGDAP